MHFHIQLINFKNRRFKIYVRKKSVPGDIKETPELRGMIGDDLIITVDDDWYYKMYYQLLLNLVEPKHENYIYLDIKDTDDDDIDSNVNSYIIREENNQKRTIVVYWNWEFNENDTTTTDSDDATLVYDESGNSNLECGFNIEIVGRQANPNIEN